MSDINKKTIIIGICGRSGSGKTTVVKQLVSLGCKHVDADEHARTVMKKGSECLCEIKEKFGENVILPSGELDRKALADIVFASKSNVSLLNSITFKYIIKSMRQEAMIFKTQGADFIIYDAPLLFEAELDKECDVIISVIADDNDCIKRIALRDGISQESAQNRLSSQKDNEFLKKRSDHIIINNGTIQDLKEKATTVFKEIKETAQNGKNEKK